MAISQLSHSVCINCSDNIYTVTDDSSGTVTAPITAETFTITYPNDDSVILNLFANDSDTLFGKSLTSSALGCTSVSIAFSPAVMGTYSYELYIIYTDSNGNLAVQPITLSSSSSSFSTVGGAIASAINAVTSTTGVSATYNSTTRCVDMSGTSFSVAAIKNGTSNVFVKSVTAETISDGKYIMTWSLTDDDSTYTSTIESYFLCNVECCVRGKMSAIDVSCECVGDKKTEAAIEAMLMLQGIKAATACGKDAKADKLLEGLQAICNNECKSC
jgi:hypothetical protein